MSIARWGKKPSSAIRWNSGTVHRKGCGPVADGTGVAVVIGWTSIRSLASGYAQHQIDNTSLRSAPPELRRDRVRVVDAATPDTAASVLEQCPQPRVGGERGVRRQVRPRRPAGQLL